VAVIHVVETVTAGGLQWHTASSTHWFVQSYWWSWGAQYEAHC